MIVICGFKYSMSYSQNHFEYGYHFSSYVNFLGSEPIEVSDDEENESLQTAIENSLNSQHS